MARFTQPTSYQDIRALSPQDYARFQDAAKERAHVLRREAVSGIFEVIGSAIARSARAALRRVAHAPRRGGRAGLA